RPRSRLRPGIPIEPARRGARQGQLLRHYRREHATGLEGCILITHPVTAIDIALEPDATMMEHAKAANARLLASFPKGFPLDETHHPHVTMLQQFVRTADLDKVYAAADAVLAEENPTAWRLKAFKYYYIPSPPLGLAGIVVEPTEDLHRLQDTLIEAIKP